MDSCSLALVVLSFLYSDSVLFSLGAMNIMNNH
jgi:hypothetical protein